MSKCNNHNFDLSKMAKGDTFMGCIKCSFQLEPKACGVNQCKYCLCEMNIYTVTEEDANNEQG